MRITSKVSRVALLLLLTATVLFGQFGVKHTFPVLATTGPAAAWLETPLALVTFPFRHTLQITVTSLPATCTVKLEGSADDAKTPFDLSSTFGCTTGVTFHVAERLAARVRPNVVTLTGTAATVKTLVQTLVELDFATHVEWDVTGGFVDSGGNAVYTHTPLEVLTETDFATHVNWSATGDMTDSTGAAVYTHSSGVGELIQASGGFANAMVADVGYVYTYTISGATGDPACDIDTTIASALTALTIADGAQTTTFTSASSPGNFEVPCTSTSGGFTMDDVSLKRVDHSATLTQVDTAYASALVASKLYSFPHTVSAVTGTPVCQITSGQTGAAVDMVEVNGAQVTELTSSATVTDDFVITCSSNVVGETITFDDVSWFEQYATNATPIVITTASAHGYSNGAQVTITGAVGNTAANVVNIPIANITTTTFELVSTTGNGARTSGGAVVSVPTVSAFYLGASR